MCCSKSFFKRIVPFFLTFAVGLFIASFFITISAPSFKFNRSFRNHREHDRMMEFENQRLKEENFRLKQNQSDGDEATTLDLSSDDLAVPPMPPAPPRSVRR